MIKIVDTVEYRLVLDVIRLIICLFISVKLGDYVFERVLKIGVD